jgi:Domain of unknown function (DUF4112)
MDDFLRVPGTKLRFGLDPIIGLLPGIGDVTSAIVSAVAFVHAARSGVPKILLARMAMNILINELVGIIPGLGDAFSFWFKSNVRNYELLRRYSAAPAGSRRGDWIFVIAILSLLFVIVCAGFIVTLLVLCARARKVRRLSSTPKFQVLPHPPQRHFRLAKTDTETLTLSRLAARHRCEQS